jgi:hypothetical protein
MTNFPANRVLVVLVSVVLFVFVVWMSGAENLWQRLVAFPHWALSSILLLMVANLFLVSFRFWRVLAHFGITVPWKVASYASNAGHAAGLVVISLFGQVVGRQVVMQQFGVQPVVNASILAYERLILLGVSGLLGVLGGVFLLGNSVVADFFRHLPIAEVISVALGGLALSLWLGRSRFEAALSGQIFSRTNLVRVILIAWLTLVGQLLVLGSFVLGILAISTNTPFLHALAASAIISLAASLPVTINGWGVRELAAVYVLGKLGISAADAVAVSVIIGLCSMLVILATVPFSLKKRPVSFKPRSATLHSVVEIEKAAAWVIGMAVAVAVFFQIHLTLPEGAINVNLADPFAILALATLTLHTLYYQQAPVWLYRRFNLSLCAISLLLLFGFLRGLPEIGITQWALGGRLLGWLVLLGYLSAGYLFVSNVGAHGLRRLTESLIATAAVIIVLQVSQRLLESWGLNPGVQLTHNFEGYAGNRNAFAFQLLAVTALLLGYSKVYARYSILMSRPTIAWIFSVLLGLLLAGLAWSASRAGCITGLLVLLVAGYGRLADRRMIGWGLIFAAMIWVGVWLLFLLEGTSAIQSSISFESSNSERIAMMMYALELWSQSPLFGTGLGVLVVKSQAWLGYPQIVHSTPLWILAEFGLVGLMVMGWGFFLLVCFAVRLGKNQPARWGLFLLLFIFAIFSLAHEIFYQRIFWFVMGAVLAHRFLGRKHV